MKYSPKLKGVIEEIKDILSREDLAGIIVLHEPGFSEFLLKIDPTYSCAKFDGTQLKLKSKLVDFNGDRDRQLKSQDDTSNMLHLLATTGGKVVLPLMDISTLMDNKINARHNDNGFSSHTTQNN